VNMVDVFLYKMNREPVEITIRRGLKHKGEK
jgi:hypothetical protein